MEKARKILALVLALGMVFALAACGSSKPGSSSEPSSSTAPSNGGGETSSDPGESSGPAGPKEMGFYDRDYDYTQHEKYRIAYMVSGTGVMYDSFDQAFARWSERLNIDYGGMWAPAEASSEAFLSGLEQYADMGYDGLLIDADSNLGARIAEICAENDVLWMMCMAQARDYSQPYSFNGEYSIGPLFAPNVGFNNIEVGKEQAKRLLQWKDEEHPDVSYDEVGFISINFSLSPQLNERTLGAKMVWQEKNPTFGAYNPDPASELKNFFIADTASGAPTQETATNLVTQIVSNAPQMKLWLVVGAFWDLTAGAAVVAQNMNMVDQFCITNFGSGASAIALWDTGEPTPIRFSLETASPVFAEAIINGLWAMMAGFATPDTLWSDWTIVYDKGDKFSLTDELDPVFQVPMVEMGADGKPVIVEEHNYASMLLPMIWTDPANYKEFYGWVDLYDLGPDATAEERTYPDYPLATDINMFNARGTIPEYYSVYPTAG
jgi:hypothetical protein